MKQNAIKRSQSRNEKQLEVLLVEKPQHMIRASHFEIFHILTGLQDSDISFVINAEHVVATHKP